MNQISKLNPVSSLVATVFSAASLALLVDGLVHRQWWSAFGLVLFMTSLIAWVALLETAPLERSA